MAKVIYLYISDEKIIRMDASVSRSGQHKFYHYASQRVQGNNLKEGYRQAIFSLCSKRMRPSAPVVVILSREILLQRILRVPNADESEFKKMTELQMQNMVPYAHDDYVIDSVKTGIDKEGNALILSLIAQKSYVKYFLDPLQELKVFPQAIIPSTSALAKSLSFTQKGIPPSTVLEDTNIKIILFVSDNAHELCVIQRGKVLYSRFFRIDKQLMGTGGIKELVDEYVQQITNTLEDYRLYYGKLENAYFFYIGYHPLKKELGAALADALEYSVFFPPILLDKPPFTKRLRIPKQEYFFLFYFLWLARFSVKEEMDLIPSETVHGRLRKKFKSHVTHVLILSILAVFIYVGIGAALPVKKMLYLEKLKSKNIGLSNVAKPLMWQGTILSHYAEKEERYVSVFELILELINIRPEDVVFDSIDMNDKQQIALKGSTLNGESIRELQKGMLDSSLISGVKLDYVNRKKSLDKELVYFQLLGTVER